MVAATKEESKDENKFPKKKEDPGCFSVQSLSRDSMLSISLFHAIGGMELKICEVRIALVDGSLKNVEGVI